MQCKNFKIGHWGLGNLIYIIQFQRYNINNLSCMHNSISIAIIWIKLAAIVVLIILAVSIITMCFAFSITFSSYFLHFGYRCILTWRHVRSMLQKRILAHGTLMLSGLDSPVLNDELKQIFGFYGEIKEVSCRLLVLPCFSLVSCALWRLYKVP